MLIHPSDGDGIIRICAAITVISICIGTDWANSAKKTGVNRV
jgi:hypothetical protein